MTENQKNQSENGGKPYLSAFGAWALAFGCAVGWGAFVMPGTTFLPIAGPVGTVVGLGLGALIMVVIARNYHYLINRYPGTGGTYSFTKKCFGYDQGFLAAWFMILTYFAIIWANATALPLIARTLLPGVFQFGFHYEVAGFHVYFGEVLLVVLALAAGALVCLRRRLAMWTQIFMAVLLFCGAIGCFAAAVWNGADAGTLEPAFSPDHAPAAGVVIVFALAPWAYVGFESISHSSGESKYKLKKSFTVMACALAAAAAVYAVLSLSAVLHAPDGNGWTAYVANLGTYSGVESMPVFYSIYASLGKAGSVILGTVAMGAIFTGIIGNYIALSRLLISMSDDELMPKWIGRRNSHGAPRNALLCILGFSVIFPFFGRVAISWIVDVTTVGATIAFAFTSAAALRTARGERNRSESVFGILGIGISFLFAVVFLVPNILSVQTLSTESYFILAAWGILGFIALYLLLKNDRKRVFGRSTVAWIVLLGLILYASAIWVRQSTTSSIDRSFVDISGYLEEAMEKDGKDPEGQEITDLHAHLEKALDGAESAINRSALIQFALIVGALVILFVIYAKIQKREREIEIEKAVAEDHSRAKTSFLSNMSHEIRTPMNAIIGLNNIALRDPELTPQTREHLERIGSSAKHLLGLINDILDMSRIESGRMALKTEEFLLREILDQINVMIQGQCRDKGLHYECRIAGRVRDYYVGDGMKLKQVLINILGNSVKFTEVPGNVSLTVSQTSEKDGRCELRFVMKDTGIGMDKEFLPKLFEAFSQEDATSTNKYGGSGLGMAITKNYVDMMGGGIQVESEKGVGSVFTVTVSLGASERTFRHGNGPVIPEGMRALVTDEDEIGLENAGIVLKEIGISADLVSSPSGALARLREAFNAGTPYDFLFAENGMELIRELRTFDGGKTAVVLLTKYGWDDPDDGTGKEAVDETVSKPLFPDTLIRTVHRILERRKGNASGTAGSESGAAESVLAGRRVLIAEDVDANAEILADLLDLEDIGFERATNGREAVDRFRSGPEGFFDAILMDVRMPVMDGLAATEAIRSLDRPDAKTVPIIAMTANVFDEDVERSSKAGMNVHLSKPIEPELLYETLARFFSEK